MNIDMIIIAYVSVHFILTTTQGVRDCYSQFTGEEMEAQRDCQRRALHLSLWPDACRERTWINELELGAPGFSSWLLLEDPQDTKPGEFPDLGLLPKAPGFPRSHSGWTQSQGRADMEPLWK